MQQLDAMSYSAEENILFIDSLARRTFVTAKDVQDAFAAIWRFWRANVRIKCYTVIDYTDVKIEKAAVEAFASERQRINAELGLGSVRFSNDATTRAMLRTMSIKIHQPSNIYANREQALAVVRGIKSGQISVATPT